MGDANKTRLRYVKETAYAQDPGGVYASGSYNFTGAGTAGDTVTINGLVYTLRASLATIVAAREVLIGATAEATANNLTDAINANQSFAGITFHSATVRHPDVVAMWVPNDTTVNIKARIHGTSGNSITITESSTAITASGGTLTGGAASVYTTAKELRFNSSSLNHQKVTLVSEEIRADRSVSELIKVGIGANGEINHELSYGDLNDFVASAMMGALVTGSNNAANWSVAAGGVLTKGAAIPAGMSGAKYLKISGFANSALNGIKRVIAQSGNTFTLAGVTATEALGASVTVSWNYVRQGVLLDSYVIEQEDQDAASVMAILGSCVNTMALTLEPRAKAMISFAFLAYGGVDRTSSVANASASPSANPIMNTTANVGNLLLSGIRPATQARRLSINVNNNLRERLAIGREGTLVPGTGTSEITGDMETYFTDKQTYDDFLAHTAKSLEATLIDNDGRVINFYAPLIKYRSGAPAIQGINTDVVLNLNWQATLGTFLDGTLGQFQVDMVA